MYTMLITLVLRQVSAAALPEPDYHVIESKNTEFRPVYSNIAFNQQRDNGVGTYYPIGKNVHGTVYSNIAPGISKRSDAYITLEPVEVITYIEEKYVSLCSNWLGADPDYVLPVVCNWATSTKSAVRPRLRNETGPLA
jgi:hypothetical protein